MKCEAEAAGIRPRSYIPSFVWGKKDKAGDKRWPDFSKRKLTFMICSLKTRLSFQNVFCSIRFWKTEVIESRIF